MEKPKGQRVVKPAFTFEHLECFLEVLAAGGFQQAAGKLRMTQSQVSLHIQELETFFGTDLLSRTPLSHTQAGHRLKVISLELMEAINDIKRGGNLCGASLTFGSGSSIIHWILLPHLRAMKAALPNTRFIFQDETKDTIIRKLCDAEFQFGLGQSAPKLKALASEPCGHMKYAIFGTPKTLKELKQFDDKEFLQNAKWGLLDDSAVLGKSVRKWFKRYGVDPDVHIVCRANHLLAEAVRVSDIVAVLPEQASSLFRDSEVVKASVPSSLATELEEVSGPLHLIWSRRTAQIRPGFELIKNTIKSILDQDSPSFGNPCQT